MRFATLARRIALLILVALYPAVAAGLEQTYEGMLVPDNREPSIPIVLELREAGSLLVGNVKTSAPLRADVPIESGGIVAGSCTINVVLSSSARLSLKGQCDKAAFDGTYTLYDAKRRLTINGNFRLVHKEAGTTKSAGARGTPASPGTVSACLNANTRCLTACPRGDETVDLMCASRCRAKLRACKLQVKKVPGDLE